MTPRFCSALSGLALVGSLVVAAPAYAAPMCNGARATIVGTSGDDTIVGTARPDVIVSLGGSDQIDGRGGNDLICSGEGDDRLYGSTGNDVLLGEGGSDTFHDGPGNDVVRPGPSTYSHMLVQILFRNVMGRAPGYVDPFKDLVYAEPGNDTITGSGYIIDFSAAKRGVWVNMGQAIARGIGTDVVKGAQEVYGTRYADRVVGSKLQDVINTGGGHDVIKGLGAGDVLQGGAGRDEIDGGNGSDVVFLSGDVANLGSGPDTAVGFESTVDGGDGNDFLFMYGVGSVNGGSGVDTLAPQGENFLAGITVDLSTGVSSTGVTFSGIEGIQGGEGNDVLTGDSNANAIMGGNGNDVIVGGGGDDNLLGNEGEDTADGGDGTDICNAELETGCE